VFVTKIQILGTGCSKCKKLADNAATAVRELGLDCEIEKIEDMRKIMAMKVLSTPALAIDGVIKSSGKLLTVDEIKKIIG